MEKALEVGCLTLLSLLLLFCYLIRGRGWIASMEVRLTVMMDGVSWSADCCLRRERVSWNWF